MKIKRIFALTLTFCLVMSILGGCGKPKFTPKPDEDGWYAAWSTALLDASVDETPFNPGLSENTVRQQIRVSIGGDKIRLTLSNAKGEIPCQIESVHIAKLVEGGKSNTIDTSTDTVITFGGSENVTIEIGQEVVSDEINFSFEALEDLAITMKMGKFTGGTETCHRGSRVSTWIAEGDHVSDETIKADKVMTSWYYISDLDVWSEAGTKTIVCIGDSITDGTNSVTNNNNRWPDELTRQLQANGYDNISVVNKGIGGNAIFGGVGTATNIRIQNDVFDVEGVRYCIMLIGCNDIGGAQEDISEKIINEFKSMIDRCHENGIEVYGGTIIPIKGSGYDSELHEQIRLKVNEFIRSENSGFDGVIDFDKAVQDPEDPASIKLEYAQGAWLDHLHPGDLGYQVMGQCAYDTLVDIWNAQTDK